MCHKKIGPIGSAVLTFIGYKQTNKQTDKSNIYIDIDSRYSVSKYKDIKTQGIVYPNIKI